MAATDGFAAQALTLQMGKRTLLDNVCLTIAPGEVLALLGPNGAGKSTFLKVLAGEFEAFSGDVLLNGRRYRDWPRDALAKTVAVLPQSAELAFPFSVLEVVALGRLPHNTGRRRDGQIVQQALQAVDGWHLRNAAYPSLSGGEKQRVQLARVLTQIWEDCGYGPRYLLLDEPTSALDLAHQHQVLDIAHTWADQQGVGVLAILHDMNLAATYADRIGLLQNGCVKASGSVEHMMTPAMLEPVFGIPITLLQHPERSRPLVFAG